MEPLPRPALMLPAIDLSGTPDIDHHTAYKKREAEWKRLISALHKEWCLCGSYINHFILPEVPLQKCTEGESEKIEEDLITPDVSIADGGVDGDGDVDGDPDAG